jgi:hypothetical protein
VAEWQLQEKTEVLAAERGPPKPAINIHF